MTIYEGITLGFIGVGIIFIILSLFFDKTKHVINEDEAAMDENEFRKQVTMVNDKILELNDYHSFIQEEIEKKHKELLFLYQMISDKEKTVRSIQVELEQLKNSLEHMTVDSQIINELPLEISPRKKELDEIIENEKESLIKEDILNKNGRIIHLKKQGYDVKEIAKILDIGQGEVRLVLNLFE